MNRVQGQHATSVRGVGQLRRQHRRATGLGLGCRRRLSAPVSSRTAQRRAIRVSASLKSQELIDQGKAYITAGNRMAAIQCFEDALDEGPSIEQQRESYYSTLCCHASFGDVELAQIYLREALQVGLDFEAALTNAEYTKFTASKQAKIQLQKFGEAYSKTLSKATPKDPSPMGGRIAEKKTVQQLLGTEDVSDMTSTELTGIDTSVKGIVTRVFALVLVLVAVGVGAYLAGLNYVLNVPELDLGSDLPDY